MLKQILLFSLVIALTSFVPAFSDAAEDVNAHIDKGNRYLVNNQPFMAVNEFRKAIAKGSDDPVLYRNLAVVLYDLGFIDEAIVEMEKALAITSDSNFLKRELGIMYLSRDKYAMALDQFTSILKSNPGFSEAYYYLGEIYYKTGEYDMAWLAAKMAMRLGHTGNDLTQRLAAKSVEPQHIPWSNPGEEVSIRQIFVELQTKADEITARLQRGDLFENIAGEYDETVDADLGGYKGIFHPNELHPDIAKALSEREALSEPVIVKTEKGYHIVQRLIPFSEERWHNLLAGKSEPKIVTVNKLLRLPPSSMKSAPPRKEGSMGDEKTASTVETEKKPLPTVSTPAVSDAKAQQQAPQHITPGPEPGAVKKIEPEQTGTYEKAKEGKKHPVEEKVAVPRRDKQKMYFVHVGTFREIKHAESLLSDLKKRGYPAYSYIIETKRGRFHKVVAGEYTTLGEAKKTGDKLKKQWTDFYISSKK